MAVVPGPGRWWRRLGDGPHHTGLREGWSGSSPSSCSGCGVRTRQPSIDSRRRTSPRRSRCGGGRRRADATIGRARVHRHDRAAHTHRPAVAQPKAVHSALLLLEAVASLGPGVTAQDLARELNMLRRPRTGYQPARRGGVTSSGCRTCPGSRSGNRVAEAVRCGRTRRPCVGPRRTCSPRSGRRRAAGCTSRVRRSHDPPHRPRSDNPPSAPRPVRAVPARRRPRQRWRWPTSRTGARCCPAAKLHSGDVTHSEYGGRPAPAKLRDGRSSGLPPCRPTSWWSAVRAWPCRSVTTTDSWSPASRRAGRRRTGGAQRRPSSRY